MGRAINTRQRVLYTMGDEFSSFTVYTYGDALVHTTSAQLRKLSWLEEQPLTSRFLHSHYLPLHLSPSPPPSLLQFASLKFLPNVSCLLLAVLKSWYPLQLEREILYLFPRSLEIGATPLVETSMVVNCQKCLSFVYVYILLPIFSSLFFFSKFVDDRWWIPFNWSENYREHTCN